MKTKIKIIIQSVAIVSVSWIILVYYLLNIIFKHSLFNSFSQFFSLFPGRFGSYCRVAFYRFTMNFCHPNIVIHFGSLFSQVNTDIEKGVYIGPQCNIGSCSIGKNSLIASGVHILSGKNQHNFTDLDTPIQQQNGCFEKISIGEDSWVGNGALIMANIGKHCIVGAGSVVTEDVDDYSIVAGNPAKLIRMRN